MATRLLFITCHHLNENNGGSNGSKSFLRCFARLFSDCTLVYPDCNNAEQFIPAAVKRVPVIDHRPRWQKGIDMYRGVVSAIPYTVRSLLENEKYDLIVIDHSVTATGIIPALRKTGTPIITIHHNVECIYLRDNSQERPLLYRHIYNHYARKAERDALKHSVLNLTVTERDASTFRTWPAVTAPVCNWGVFEYNEIATRILPEPIRANKFITTGSLCFIQSAEPIINFLRNYWPIVLQLYPDAQLTIAGRNPGRDMQTAVRQAQNVTLVANPENMEALVAQHRYYICPISAGSGHKLRVRDGLKQGLPILCHEVSRAGYECIEQAHALFAYNDQASFTQALTAMIATKTHPQQVYHAFQQNFSLEKGTSLLEHILRRHNLL